MVTVLLSASVERRFVFRTQDFQRIGSLCERSLKKWHLEFASPLGDYLNFLCILLSFAHLLKIIHFFYKIFFMMLYQLHYLKTAQKKAKAITVLKKEGAWAPRRYDHDHRFNDVFKPFP